MLKQLEEFYEKRVLNTKDPLAMYVLSLPHGLLRIFQPCCPAGYWLKYTCKTTLCHVSLLTLVEEWTNTKVSAEIPILQSIMEEFL